MKDVSSLPRAGDLRSFEGTITRVAILEANFGRAVLEMTLENREDVLDVIFEPDGHSPSLPDTSWGPVRLLYPSSESPTEGPVTGYKLSRIDALNGLDCLPASQVSKPDLVDETETWVSTCPVPVLRKFTWQVLGQSSIGVPFFQARASQDHHHAFAGGLADHSLAVARLTLQSLPDMNEREAWLCAIAGLMHDIGKIRCFDENGTIAPGFVLKHEHWTLEVLAKALSWLDRQWSDGALAIRYLLTAKDATAGYRPLLPGVMAIAYADRMNSALNVRAQAFAERPQWQRFAKTQGFGPPSSFWLPNQVSL
ncbi:HD domain-containing protein [Marinobacter sp. tcs-11]|uniref:HD domain-containing protein n=1 Tax=Marinobacter sp. tcs-11 TaxID=1742860 RepID=UPI00257CE43A|nr:HD domain-containing protein [Marinobacter sp. tcs-11]